MYDALKSLLRKHEGRTALERCSEAHLNSLARRHAGIPQDYLAYLTELGAGEVGVLTIFREPMEASEVYGPAAEGELARLLVVGTYDFGECIAFDPDRDWRLVEIRESLEVAPDSRSFHEYMVAEVPPRLR